LPTVAPNDLSPRQIDQFRDAQSPEVSQIKHQPVAVRLGGPDKHYHLDCVIWRKLQVSSMSLANARVKPVAISLAQRGQKQPGHARDGALSEIGEQTMEFLMEERVNEKLTVATMHRMIDADDATLKVDVAVIAHAVVDDPAPSSSRRVDEGRPNVAGRC